MENPNRAMVLGTAIVLSLGAFAWWWPGRDDVGPEKAPVLGALYAAPVERVETEVLARGETISDVMARVGIVGAEFTDLLLALREHVSPRRMTAGSEITIRRWARDGSLRSVEVRVNADTTVRLGRGVTGWTSEVIETPVIVDTLYVDGQIEAGRTLFEAFVEDGGLDLPYQERAALVWDLASVYEFKLDFAHDIHPGDRYRVLYEREARPDGSARRRRILVAEIVSQGREYPAIYFDPDGRSGNYYDLDGRSLRSAFSRYPVQYARITSSFSWRRYHPILGIYRAHLGTDFGAPTGTPVRATADGTVSFAGRDGGYGNVVILRHFGGYSTRYAHLSRFASGIRRGRAVKQGQTIGYVGSTGLATGPHLHYELRKNGRPIDARSVRLPGAIQLKGAVLEQFKAHAEQRVALLDRASGRGAQLAAAPAEASGAGAAEAARATGTAVP
ncbi:MAG TPA: M23 family metallopeptidase [Longimicrobiales bacterium]